MKTFREFQKETQQLDEALPALIPAALKLGGMALTAYSGYSAAKNLAKGNYKQAGMDAAEYDANCFQMSSMEILTWGFHFMIWV